ncbi:transcriptional regulator [Saccharophagus sp. K07]|nr:transcriptional regulator [Saccharophagus sp. K07]
MLIEKGQVTRLMPADGSVWVSTIQASACDACRASAGCGQRLMSRLIGRSTDIRARLDESSLNLEIGDQVEIGIEEGAVVAASLLAYGLPLLSFVVSIWLCESMALAPILAVVVCLIGLSLGLSTSRFVLRTRFTADFFEPVVLRKIPDVNTKALELQ